MLSHYGPTVLSIVIFLITTQYLPVLTIRTLILCMFLLTLTFAECFAKHVTNHKWDFITNTLDLHKDCTRLESSLMNSVNYAKRECKSYIYTYSWMSSAIFTSCKQKNTLYKKMRKGLVSEKEYKTYRNQLTNLIRVRKKQFYSDICSRHKNDIKIIWDHLNHLLGRNSKTTNTIPKNIDSNSINNFFLNLGPSTISNLALSKFHYSKYIKQQFHSFFCN